MRRHTAPWPPGLGHLGERLGVRPLAQAEGDARGFLHREIGKAVAKGSIDLNAVGDMDADAAHVALTALHGVGPWTADIYLLFCLGNADAWPAGDLALQEAARIAFGLKKRPDAKAMNKLGEAWRPWRGVAAHLLWAYYHVVKRREGAPVQATWPAVTKKQKAQKKNGAASGP